MIRLQKPDFFHASYRLNSRFILRDTLSQSHERPGNTMTIESNAEFAHNQSKAGERGIHIVSILISFSSLHSVRFQLLTFPPKVHRRRCHLGRSQPNWGFQRWEDGWKCLRNQGRRLFPFEQVESLIYSFLDIWCILWFVVRSILCWYQDQPVSLLPLSVMQGCR